MRRRSMKMRVKLVAVGQWVRLVEGPGRPWLPEGLAGEGWRGLVLGFGSSHHWVRVRAAGKVWTVSSRNVEAGAEFEVAPGVWVNETDRRAGKELARVEVERERMRAEGYRQAMAAALPF